ncbi:MAG: tetratricopeptide repeat protein [Bacteroidales bacterium]|nr:tetratricopeptide repeat protein [Bacteroidales bacterium]
MTKEKKGEILLEIGQIYFNNFDLDSALKYYNFASDNLTSDENLMSLNQNIGLVYFYKDDFKETLEYFQKSLTYSISIGYDSLIACRYSDIGVVYDYLTAYDKAVEYYFKALKIFENLNDKAAIAKIYNNLGVIYKNRGQFEPSLEYLEKALELKKESGAKNIEIASTYVNIGATEEEIKNYDKALKNYQIAFKIFKQENFDKYIAVCQSNIAGIFYYQNILDSAIIYNELSIKTNFEIDNNLGLVSAYFLKGKIFIKYKNNDSAIFYLEKANKLAEELGVIDKKEKILTDLISIYETKNYFSKAFFLQKDLLIIKDSLNNEKLNDKIETLQIIYETEKKEQQISNLHEVINKNKLLLIAVAFILSLMIILGFMIFRQKLAKSRYEAKLFNQKLLRLQMNPHFIFNALTSIQSFMLEKDTKQAAIYLSAFSKLTRSILNNSREEFITLQEEFETAENYLKIQQMRYENKFNFKIEVDPKLDMEKYFIPPMISQPFVENAVVHGFKDIDYKGEIIITYKKSEENIQITIEDNGKGISKKNIKKHKSHATDITKERLEILNKNKKNIISFKIINLNEISEQSGTKVIFTLPTIEK